MENNSQSIVDQIASDLWQMLLLKGILAIVLGILFLASPGITLIVIMMYLGAYWFVDGVFTLIASFKGKKENKNWGMGILVSVLSILAGIAVFTQPIFSTFLTTTLLVYFMGFIVMASGISSISTGFKLEKSLGKWVMILSGVLAIILALLLLLNPVFSAAAFISLLGIFAIIGGISLIIFALQVRKFKNS